MARIPISTKVDNPEYVSDPLFGGSVLYDERAAQILGFDAGVVKLRFADGEEAEIALADYVLRARAVDGRESDALDDASSVPWQSSGWRAHRIRKMFDGYMAGRRTALRELEGRAT